MGSLLVALALVAVVGVKYRQSQEEVDSKGGYWRAPSIQAMLYDDSAHEHDHSDSSSFSSSGAGAGAGAGVAMGRVVEMGDLDKSSSSCGYTAAATTTAIPVTLSPISSDEIRV